MDCVDLMKRPRRSGGGGTRQADGERGALTEPAGNRDAAVHRPNEVLDDRQAQAGAAELAGAGLVHPVEALEDARQVVLGNADAGVLDVEAGLAAVEPPADAEAA